ncbi:tryptophan-rich sensory protein [Lewinella cohaerens]|uniref:tryptophan-rich sensory protein n=1 Tax=Lewinella cohaerens TaxID=70995 RepID=UPI000375F78E|nr:tryptophan-rich sensory protein [Lewinella cohaerens]
MRTKTLQTLNLIGFLLVLLLNTLANALPLNGYNTGELSDRYPNFFVPAGFTFSIWGVIYLLLIIFIIYQLRSWWKKQDVDLSFVQKIGPWFFISCLANASWILAWHYLQITLSLLIMLIILGSLIIIYLRLGIGESSPTPPTNKWTVRLPFSIYLGWITVATIANVTTLLVDNGWQGGAIGPISWAAVMIVIAGLIGILILVKRADIGFVLVLIWAFYGIYAKQSGNTTADVDSILLAAKVVMALLAVAAASRFKKWLTV